MAQCTTLVLKLNLLAVESGRTVQPELRMRPVFVRPWCRLILPCISGIYGNGMLTLCWCQWVVHSCLDKTFGPKLLLQRLWLILVNNCCPVSHSQHGDLVCAGEQVRKLKKWSGVYKLLGGWRGGPEADLLFRTLETTAKGRIIVGSCSSPT